MKISKVLFALIGCQTSSYALPLSDELKALSNFDFWADSVTSRIPYGKEPVSFWSEDITWQQLDNEILILFDAMSSIRTVK